MWGNLITEATFQTNFNVGFSNTKSDILIHLSQWQYWWWFWFVFLWSLYFLLILRVVRFRTLKFQPRLVTSFRPHGKWGDLLVCLIPTTWCINILINSSFLLKLIEWQNESSLFTIRIRGRQWYWVYKFDLKDVTDIMAASKNVGNNKWFYSNSGSLDHADDYLHLMQLRAANVWLKKYWDVSLKMQGKENYEHLIASIDQLPNNKLTNLINKKNVNNINNIQDNFKVVNYNNLDESLRWVKRSYGISAPIKIIKSDINNPSNESNLLFKARFSTNSILHKNITYAPYLVIKQKRYTLKKKILEKNFKIYSNTEDKSKVIKSKFFIKNNVGQESIDNMSKIYKFLKKNKKKDEIFNIATSRRLLRTRHTLVLPAHVNITAITNSYDVVHSWFIPGLGLKLDCIPGRATHHTFYADNVGFYYGQCAEICGRYHHHMPIRLCVLPYEQFLLWWHHFGLPKLMYSGKNKQLVNTIYYRKYIW